MKRNDMSATLSCRIIKIISPMTGIQYGNNFGSFGHHTGTMVNLHILHETNNRLATAAAKVAFGATSDFAWCNKESIIFESLYLVKINVCSTQREMTTEGTKFPT